MYLPSRAIGTAIVFRSLLLWAGIRAASLAVGTPPTLGVHSLLVLTLVAILARHDHAILNEDVLMANTGVSHRMRGAFATAPAMVAELALHTVFA